MTGIAIARDSTRAVPLASMYQRASTRCPAAVEQPVTRSPAVSTPVTRSQMNVVPRARAWSNTRVSSSARSTCRVNVSNRSGGRRITGGGAACHAFFPISQTTMRFLGVAIRSASSAATSMPMRRSSRGLDQSNDSPTWRCG
ncbi:MAG: hypothetical protein ABI868_20150 [Acidobacteriota bacterium]